MPEQLPISTQSENFVPQDIQLRKGRIAQFVEKHPRLVRRSLAVLTVGMLGLPSTNVFAQEQQPQTPPAPTSPEVPEGETTLNDTLVEGFSADFETISYPDQGIVIAQSVVNMRSKPTTAEQNVIDQLAGGDIANVLGEEGAWVQIQKVLPEGQEKDETTGYSVTTLGNGAVLLQRVSHDELATDPTIIPSELMHHYVTTGTLQIDSSTEINLANAFGGDTGGSETDEALLASVFGLDVDAVQKTVNNNGKLEKVFVEESEITNPQTKEQAFKRILSIAALSSDLATQEGNIVDITLRGGLKNETNLYAQVQKNDGVFDLTLLSGDILIAAQVRIDADGNVIPGSIEIAKMSPGALLYENDGNGDKTQKQLDALTNIGDDEINQAIEGFDEFRIVVPTENGRLFINEVSDAELEEAGITKRGEITYSVDAEGSIIATHFFEGLETTLIFSENKGWEEVVEMESSETPIRTTLEGDQLPWELMDVKEGLFRYELFHDPTPLDQLNKVVTSADYREVTSIKISESPTQYPFEFAVPEFREYVMDSDDKGLASKENTGTQRIDNMMLWIFSESLGISPQEAAEKLEHGDLSNISLPGGKNWDTRKPVQILVEEAKFNADPISNRLKGTVVLGWGYNVTELGTMQLLIQVPSFIGAQNDLPRTQMFTYAMTTLAQDFGIEVFKSGNQSYCFPLFKIAWTPGDGTLASIFDTTH